MNATDWRRRSIEVLDLPLRAERALKRAGLTTLGQVHALSDSELEQVRSFGPASLREVRTRLTDYKRRNQLS